MHAAGKQVLFRLELGLFYPDCNGISGLLGNLELAWPLGLVLHDDGAAGNLISLSPLDEVERASFIEESAHFLHHRLQTPILPPPAISRKQTPSR